MAYADLLDDESIDSQFLIVMKPRREPTGWSVFSGSVYVADFDFGEVVEVEENGTSLTQASSTSLSSGEFYYDVTNEKLYVRTTGDVDPSTINTIATYELYVATNDAHFNRVPTDSSTREVYFEPVVSRSPALKTTIRDNLFGFAPVQSSSIALINAEHIFEKHISDSSFSQARVQVYHFLKELKTENVKLIYDGLMRDISHDDASLRITTYSREDVFSERFRNDANSNSFVNTTDYPNADPNRVGKPIRYVYGVVDGFKPINIDWVEDNPTTSDNRDFIVLGDQSNLANVSAAATGGGHTATTTNLASGHGLRAGDHVYMNRAVGTDEYVIVTSTTTTSITHPTLTGGAMSDGDTIERSFVGAITIVKNDVTYQPLFNRDYTTATFSGGVSGFTFSTSMESNLGMGTLSASDRIFVRVYGRKNDITLGGPAYGSNDSESGNITHPGQIILDILKRVLGIPESEINNASFTQLLTDRTDALGFAIPSSSSSSFPKIKNVITDVIKTSLLKLYINDDNEWTVVATGQLGSTTKSIEDDEILRASFKYKFTYRDILSDVIVRYNDQETSVSNDASARSNSVTATSDRAKYLHKVNKEKVFDSLHFKQADAQILANRLSDVFGDREGQLEFRTKNRFFDTEIDDNIAVTRTKMPGFEFDEDTLRTKNFSVVSTQKGLNEITIKMDDQKGIEDNESGSW